MIRPSFSTRHMERYILAVMVVAGVAGLGKLVGIW